MLIQLNQSSCGVSIYRDSAGFVHNISLVHRLCSYLSFVRTLLFLHWTLFYRILSFLIVSILLFFLQLFYIFLNCFDFLSLLVKVKGVHKIGGNVFFVHFNYDLKNSNPVGSVFFCRTTEFVSPFCHFNREFIKPCAGVFIVIFGKQSA